MKYHILFPAVLLASVVAQGNVALQKVSEAYRPTSSVAEQISGISWAGGNLFYTVDDNDNKLYPLTIAIGSDGSLVKADIQIGEGIEVDGAKDMEGCAVDLASGLVWVSDETGPAIREVDPATGKVVRSAPVPEILKNYYGNYSLEALTVSGDGKTMWTCNEEALKCDGTNSTKSVGTVVRLTRFTRDSVYDNWTCRNQFAYYADPIGSDPYPGKGRSGVSALAALPDGTLLVLERTLWGDNAWDATFYNRIYHVDGLAEDGSRATDVFDIPSLKDVEYKRVKKTSLFNKEVGWANYEGMCLGPRLADGSLSLLLLSDAGSCTAKIMTFKLTGLDAWTADFAAPASGTSSIVGGPYRFMNGATVDVTLSGAAYPSAYTNNATHVCTGISWSAGEQSGAGPAASFVASSDVSFRWEQTFATSETPIDFAENFETYPVYSEVEKGEVGIWKGAGVIAAATPPAPPTGYPMAKDPHEQVLNVDDLVSCQFPCTTNGNDRLDVLVSIRRRNLDEVDGQKLDGALVAFDCDSTGHLRFWTRAAQAWRQLEERAYEDGEWIRISIALSTPKDGGETLATVCVNGVVRATDVPVAEASENAAITALDVRGQVSLDDVLKTASGYESEFAPAGVVDGVPVLWLHEGAFELPGKGLLAPGELCPAARYPVRAANGYTIADVYNAGLDAAADELFDVTSVSYLPDGRIRLAVNGVREDVGAPYSVTFRENLQDSETPVLGDTAVETVEEDGVEHIRTVWTSRTSQNAASGFYCVRVN